MEFDKFISILCSVLILINGFCYYQRFKTWFSPAGLFSLFWFIYTFLPLVLVWSAKVHWISCFYILIAVLVFSLPTLMLNPQKFGVKRNIVLQEEEKMKFFLIGLIFISITGNIYQVVVQGISLSDIIGDVISVGGRIAQKRYGSELTVSLFGRIGMLTSYLSVLLGGVYYNFSKARSRSLILIGCFIPFIIILLTQSQKGLILLAFFFFVGTTIGSKLLKGELFFFSRKSFLTTIISVGVISVFVIISFLSRGLVGVSDFDLIYEVISSKLISYSCGHLYGFSEWFNAFITGVNDRYGFNLSSPHYGKYTFMAVWEILFSYEHKIMGIYDEYVEFYDTSRSNIFTWFRGLIMDFGILGSLLFIFILSIFTNLLYSLIFNFKLRVLGFISVVFMTAFFYMTWIISFFTWAIIPMVYVAFIILLVLIRYVKVK